MIGYCRMDSHMNKNIKNNPIANYFVITLDGRPSFEKSIAEYMHLDIKEYINILKKCGAKFIKNGYYFINEDDAIKAVITLKLMAA